MDKTSTVLFLLLVSSCFLDVGSCQSQERVCIVSGDDKKHDDHCDKYLELDDLCLMKDETLESNMVLVFLEEDYTLNCTIEVKHTANIFLKGSKTRMKCSNGGFVFRNVSNVSISDLELRGCGSHYLFDKMILDQYINVTQIVSALVFTGGENLTLSHVTISEARFCGLCLHNVAGNITVDSCNITNATSTNITSLSGNVVVYDTELNANVKIQHCHIANSGYRGYKRNCVTNNHSLYSYSSGLSLFLESKNLTIAILNTQFLQNTGCNGGNMAILLLDLAAGSSKPMVTINDTQFEEGSADYGGGLYITLMASYDKNFSPRIFLSVDYSEIFLISNCNFTNNSAESLAGGLYIDWKEIVTNTDQILDAGIISTTFDGNHLGPHGRGGLGIHYKTYIDSVDQPHRLSKLRVNLKLEKCGFYNHNQASTENELNSVSSVILAKSAPYLEINGVNISSNNCTGILSIDSVIVFSGSSEISHNWALNGGGMRLCSGALLYFKPNTELLITGNTVEHNGGGILVNNKCLVNVPMCFYQYTYNISHNASLLETVNVTITNNSAGDAGDNIYGGSIDYCYLLYVKQSNKHYQNQLNVPKNTNVTPSSISSDAQLVLIGHPQANKHRYTEKKSFTIYPGENIQLFVRVVGQLFGAVSGTVSATSDESLVLEHSDQVKNVPKSGSHKYYQVYSSTKEIINGGANLYLHTDSEEGIFKRKNNSRVVVKINFKPCPLGFINTNKSGKFECQCVQSLDLEKCFIKNHTIRKDKTKWVGIFSNNSLSYGHCPLGYCNPDVVDIPALEDSLDQDVQCNYNRTGIMCGSCPKGWSLVLGTSACSNECSNTWLLLIIPFALLGLLLVAIIHFLNLTITTGTVCGLIFYVNIVQDYSIVVLGEQPVPILTPLLQVFLAWFNLDLGIQTCFYHGMSAFEKTLLQGVFPLYIWLISAVIVFLSNRYLSVTRFVGENAVKVLATLFLLSYSKMLRVTIGVLNFKTLHVASGSDGPTVRKVRWILDGNISYLNLRHSILIVLSSIFLVVILPFSFGLFCLKKVHSLSNFFPRGFSWINRLKPFFDAFTGPFKDNTRFWPGLLLLARLLLLVTHTADYNTYIAFPYIATIITCVVLLFFMVVYRGVYSRQRLDFLESFFILNLCLVAAAQVVGCDNTNTTNLNQQVIGHLAVSVAFITFLMIVAYHTYLKCVNLKWLRNKKVLWNRDNLDIKSIERMRGYNACDSTSNDVEYDGESVATAGDRMISYPSLDYNYKIN